VGAIGLSPAVGHEVDDEVDWRAVDHRLASQYGWIKNEVAPPPGTPLWRRSRVVAADLHIDGAGEK